jgi:hypothetical protein
MRIGYPIEHLDSGKIHMKMTRYYKVNFLILAWLPFSLVQYHCDNKKTQGYLAINNENKHLAGNTLRRDTIDMLLDLSLYNEKDFQRFYQEDSASIASFALHFQGISDEKFRDSLYYIASVMNYQLDPKPMQELHCKLFYVGIYRKMPDMFAQLGQVIFIWQDCGTNRYKGALYIIKAAQLNDFTSLRVLMGIASEKRKYSALHKLRHQAAEIGDGLAMFELYEWYYNGVIDIGKPFDVEKDSLNKEKGMHYLNLAVKHKFPEALYVKATQFAESREEAFDLLVRGYHITSPHPEAYFSNYFRFVEMLGKEFTEEWSAYKKSQGIKD